MIWCDSSETCVPSAVRKWRDDWIHVSIDVWVRGEGGVRWGVPAGRSRVPARNSVWYQTRVDLWQPNIIIYRAYALARTMHCIRSPGRTIKTPLNVFWRPPGPARAIIADIYEICRLYWRCQIASIIPLYLNSRGKGRISPRDTNNYVLYRATLWCARPEDTV